MGQLDLMWATVIWILCAVKAMGTPGSCPDGWIGPSEDFFCYFVFSDRDTSYNAAISRCSALSSHVAMPKTQRQWDFIATNVITWNNYEVWVGIYGKDGGAKWEWYDGQTFIRSDFQNFKPDQPDGRYDEYCIRVQSDGWRDTKCSNRYTVVCQMLLLLHDCPVSWERSPSDNMCYSRGYDDGNYWLTSTHENAISLCRSLSSNLIMPKTDSMNKFILDTFELRQSQYEVWIGLTDLLEEGFYKWDDGTNLETGFWNPGEPDSDGSYFSPDCVVMSDPGNWNVKFCNNFVSYNAHVICQCAVPLPADRANEEHDKLQEGTTVEDGSVPAGMAICSEEYSTTKSLTTSQDTTTSQETTSLTTTEISTTSLSTMQDEIDTSTFNQGSTTELSLTTTTTTTTTTTELSLTTTKPPPCCPCWRPSSNITEEELQSMIRDLISATKVEKNSLSSTTRKLTSASDPRPSSKSVGYAGIALIVTILCFILILDLVPSGK